MLNKHGINTKLEFVKLCASFPLRIDNSRQRVICGIRLSSLAIDCILICYILNEKSYFSLSNHILDIINCPVFQKCEFKTIFITFIF